MRIAITGGTGFLGGAIVEEALRHGHQVLLLTRRPGAVHARPGVEAVDWSNPNAALPPCDAVIHLAGENIGERWTEEKKQKILASRRDGTRRLVESLAAMPDGRPEVLVSASAVGYYGERGEELLGEGAAPGTGYLADVCRVWEAEAHRAESLGMRVALMRLGVVLGEGGGALSRFLTPFKLGIGGPLGNGRQWFPWVHISDVAGLFLTAVENDEIAGPVNVVAPGIVRGDAFARELGRAMHRPALVPVPVFGLRLLLGDFADHLIESQHVTPETAQRAGYVFRMPELPAALENILA